MVGNCYTRNCGERGIVISSAQGERSFQQNPWFSWVRCINQLANKSKKKGKQWPNRRDPESPLPGGSRMESNWGRCRLSGENCSIAWGIWTIKSVEFRNGSLHSQQMVDLDWFHFFKLCSITSPVVGSSSCAGHTQREGAGVCGTGIFVLWACSFYLFFFERLRIPRVDLNLNTKIVILFKEVGLLPCFHDLSW